MGFDVDGHWAEAAADLHDAGGRDPIEVGRDDEVQGQQRHDLAGHGCVGRRPRSFGAVAEQRAGDDRRTPVGRRRVGVALVGGRNELVREREVLGENAAVYGYERLAHHQPSTVDLVRQVDPSVPGESGIDQSPGQSAVDLAQMDGALRGDDPAAHGVAEKTGESAQGVR